MSSQSGRYAFSSALKPADGWSFQRLTPPSRLFGANGIRTGGDGRIYVAQVAGSQISAIDVNSGAVETISPQGGDIVAPDDLVMDDAGNIFATEITEGRVSVLKPNGETNVLLGDTPCANPITMHQGRLYSGECRPGGRLMELNLNGGAPRVLLDDVPMPNAMEVGPDGMLYFPVMAANEIWRINLQGGAPEVVATDLGVPDAVKFDAEGFIVSTQVASGQVLRINPNTGEKTVLATIAPGLDNLTFVGDRLFVSSISGQINEITAEGQVESLIPDGLQWPMGLAVGGDGELFVADGGFTYSLRQGNKLECLGMLFTPGFPGFTRGVAAAGPGEWIVTTANGDVARYCPAKQACEMLVTGQDLDRLMGVAITPSGAPVVAEYGTGRVLLVESSGVTTLASDLKKPMGVAVSNDGTCFVAESAGGRIVKLAANKVETVVDGLSNPQGIAIQNDKLFIVDVGAKKLFEFDCANSQLTVLASDLPVGAPPGVVPKPLNAIGVLSGPMTSFTGLAVGNDATIYLSADAEGSVIALRPEQDI